MKRVPAALTGAGVVALVMVVSVWAGTVVGTAKNDVLRGTSAADKLYGLGGDDRLYGLAGDDLLVGGPGKDVFVCGAGRDTVVGGTGDRAGADCEVVRGVPTAVALPSLTIDRTREDEAAAAAKLNVTLSKPSARSVTVDWATEDLTARAGTDYVAAHGTLTFAPGQVKRTIEIGLVVDSDREPREKVVIRLSNAVGATIADGYGWVEIWDDAPG